MYESAEQDAATAQIRRKDLIMLMLGLESSGDIGLGMGGITRLQKFLFLLEQ